MQLKSIFRDIKGKNGRDDKNRNQIDQKFGLRCRNIQSSPQGSPSQESPWTNLPPELLLDIIGRLEADETKWPARRSVVACAAVCKSWRAITREIIRTPEECGLVTLPISLKQPGPRNSPIQCFIRRDRATSTYRLYLGLNPALAGNSSKFLLAAKRIRKATKTDFMISLAANEFSQTSEKYTGKLRSNFLGSKFFIHDCQASSSCSIPSRGWSWKRISARKVSPRLPVCSYNVASISYELNVLRTRGPRRVRCTMHTIPASATQEGGSVPPPIPKNPSFHVNAFCRPTIPAKSKDSSENMTDPCLVLENKVPRWHEQLQCWCLNFRGRVTVASVKNFQLVAAVDLSQNGSASEDEKVLLQFGKIGKDIFTMDYRYPLSAFQAFAICLSSFDTKPACE